jgi:hypothetical protein
MSVLPYPQTREARPTVVSWQRDVAVSRRNVRWTGPLPVKTNCRNCRQLPSSALRCVCGSDPQRRLMIATHYTLNSIHPLAKQQHHSPRVAQQCATKFPGMPRPKAWASSVGAVREPPFRVIPCQKTSLGVCSLRKQDMAIRLQRIAMPPESFMGRFANCPSVRKPARQIGLSRQNYPVPEN